MQRFSYRESVLLGYSPQKALMESNSAPKDPDIDFDDVFGGPPRRSSSIQETRYSFGENSDSSSSSTTGFRTSDETFSSSRNIPRLSGLGEKPVFGEEGMNRRRYSKTDFFDDIFRGNDKSTSSSSSPRKYETKDPFATSSQYLSSSARLPLMAEPFGTSLPIRFSLLNKGMDLPTFGSPTRSTSRSQDGSSNGLSYYANETETKGNSIEDSTTSGISKDGVQFHFSIYKWDNKGVVPLAIRGNDKLKEKDKLQRCSSAKGWIACESTTMESKADLHSSFCSTDDRMSSNAKSFGVERDKNGDVSSRIDSRNEDGERVRTIQEDNIPKFESEQGKETKKPRSKTLKLFLRDEANYEQGKYEMNRNDGAKDISKKSDKELYEILDGENIKKLDNMKLNTTRVKGSLRNSEDNEKGNNEMARNNGTKDISEKSAKKLHEILDGENIKNMDASTTGAKGKTKNGETIKNQDATKRTISNNIEASSTRVKGSLRNSGENGKGRVRGKVKEFIKIFNQDSSPNPTTDDICHDPYQPVMTNDTVPESRSSKQQERHTIESENEPNVIVTQKNTTSSITDPVSDSFTTIIEDPRDSFDDNFSIKDLTPEEKNFPEFGIDPEEIKKWLNGKEENIRSLLSTLQYVLWPESGWKPVPLVDIIEGPAVKRSYQKALLCLHPDKLQQKGAASDHKYIAEKVFDVLQDAWTHFNSLGSV